MPSAIIHRTVAKKVLEKMNLFTDYHDLYLYEVGAVAPDSWRNCTRFKDSPLPKIEKRKYSHFSNPGSFIEYYDVFYNKYKDDLENPFMLGYLVHLITDKNWRDDMFFKCFLEDGSIKLLDGSTLNDEKEVLKELLHSESKKVASFLCNYFDLKEIRPLKEEEIHSLPKMEELEYDGINKTISFINCEMNNPINEPTKVYKLEDFIEGIERCSDFIISELKRYDIKKKNKTKY